MNWPLLAAATTLAEVLHYTRCQAHRLPPVPYRQLSGSDRAMFEEVAMRTLEGLANGQAAFRICNALARANRVKVIGRIGASA